MANAHRLGFQGEWGLKGQLVQTADRMGLLIQKSSLLENDYALISAKGRPYDLINILPSAIQQKESYSFKEVKKILTFMMRPVAAIAQSLGADKAEADRIRRDLHAVLRFASSGKIKPQKMQLDNFDTYHEEHDDECEDVAQEMEEEAAWRYDDEFSGNLLPGLKFGKNSGKILLSMDYSAQEGSAQQQLQTALFAAVTHATGNDPQISKPEIVTLTTRQFEELCKTLKNKLDASPELLKDAAEEELLQDTVQAVQDRIPHIQNSSYFNALKDLKPEQLAQTDMRLAALSVSAHALQNFINTDEVKRAWKRFNITKRNNPVDIETANERLEALKAVIAQFTHTSTDKYDAVTAEAIAHEFTDVISFGRALSGYIKSGISDTAHNAAQLISQWEFMEQSFAQASLGDVSVSRQFMDEAGKNISHYIGRYVGTEGVDYIQTFKDFVDDFGGEIVEFYQKYPVLTSAAVISFYYAMNSGGGGAEVMIIPPEFQAAASIDPITGLPLTIDTPQDLVFKQCHWHSPVKLPFFEHCILSNQAVAQLEDAYALFKTPLTMILDAPEGSVSMIEGLRGADAPAFAFAESFNSSLKTTGDIYFVANGYQNLAHAPWFGIAAIMGWKLGAVEALKRSSFLVTPLIDAGYALATTKPLIMAGSVTGAAYGYSMQGLSGGVSGAVMGALPGWGIHSTIDFARKIPNLSVFQDNNIAQGLTAEAVSRKKLDSLTQHNQFEFSIAPVTLPALQGDEKQAAQSFEPLSARFKIGGETVHLELDKDQFTHLELSLIELAYILETQSDKIGIEEGLDGYKDELLARTNAVITALKEYKNEPDLKTSGYTEHARKVLENNLDTLIGAEMLHLGRTKIFDTFEQPMSRRQKGQFAISAGQKMRSAARNEAHHEDIERLSISFNKAVRSFGSISSQPLLVPISLAYKTASAAGTGLRMSIREAGYQIASRISDIRFQWNKVEPKTKGNIIGAGMTVTAAAISSDFSPQISSAVQDNLGVNAQAALHTLSDGAGKAAGAATATGLFGIYNFGEDHMVVHVGLGYMFILAAAGAKNLAYKPFQALAVKPAKVIGQGLVDIANDNLGLKMPSTNPLQQTVSRIRNYLDKAKTFDPDQMTIQPD